MKITNPSSFFLAISLSFASAIPIFAGPAKDGWIQHVAVCTLPPNTDPKSLGNASRGIAFTSCPHPPAGQNLASVAITADSGFQEQFFAAGTLDPYWVKLYLSPLVPGFQVDCWKAPVVGCAKPVVPAAAPPARPPRPARAVKPAAPPSDAQLLPLVRR